MSNSEENPETSPIRKSVLAAKNLGVESIVKSKQIFVTQLVPQSKKYTMIGYKFCNEKLSPTARKGAEKFSQELLKIHRKQNWLKRFSVTMLDNSAGLGMAMVSAKLVESFVEVREFVNLWGLLATRPVVSETTYEILSFVIEFFVALLAFTLTEHYRDEYRQSKKTISD